MTLHLQIGAVGSNWHNIVIYYELNGSSYFKGYFDGVLSKWVKILIDTTSGTSVSFV
jgi:hypothetical protein